MFHANGISVTSIILQMKSISPPARPILITAGFPIWSINGVEHPEPDLKLENSGHTTTSNPTVITFMQTQGPSPTQYGLNKWDLCALFLTLELILKIVWCNLTRSLRKLKRTACVPYKCVAMMSSVSGWLIYISNSDGFLVKYDSLNHRCLCHMHSNYRDHGP